MGGLPADPYGISTLARTMQRQDASKITTKCSNLLFQVSRFPFVCITAPQQQMQQCCSIAGPSRGRPLADGKNQTKQRLKGEEASGHNGPIPLFT